MLAAVFLALWLGEREPRTSTPNLIEVADRVFEGTDAEYHGNEESLSVTVTDDSEAASFVAVNLLLAELGFSSATSDRIANTRALDGTLTATGDNVNATWTYHPDDGLQIVFEADDSP